MVQVDATRETQTDSASLGQEAKKECKAGGVQDKGDTGTYFIYYIRKSVCVCVCVCVCACVCVCVYVFVLPLFHLVLK